MDVKNIAVQLRDEASRLTKAADLLDVQPPIQPINQPNTILRNAGKRTGSRVISRATREKLSRAQKARWAERKAQTQAA